jgi:hypothetical protein
VDVVVGNVLSHHTSWPRSMAIFRPRKGSRASAASTRGLDMRGFMAIEGARATRWGVERTTVREASKGVVGKGTADMCN